MNTLDWMNALRNANTCGERMCVCVLLYVVGKGIPCLISIHVPHLSL